MVIPEQVKLNYIIKLEIMVDSEIEENEEV